MRYRLAEHAPDGVLAGSRQGQEVFSALLLALPPAESVTFIYLDFLDVEIATGSFLRESVFAFQRYVRDHVPLLYPVMANMNATISEELSLFLNLKGEALVTCILDEFDQSTNGRVIGSLDGKQLEALLAVLSLKETDAPTLAKTTPDQKPTVWNNRLSALVAKGVLMEIGTNKTKRYRPILEGLSYGS